MERNEHPDDIVQIMPADGWRVAYKQEDGKVFSNPLVGWALTSIGNVYALDTDSTGYVEMLTHSADFERIFRDAGDEWREEPTE